MKLNGLIAIWTSGPTTTKTATGSRKIWLMNRSMREASYGHVAIREGMQRGAKRVNMMFGSNGRVLEREEALTCGPSKGSSGLEYAV